MTRQEVLYIANMIVEIMLAVQQAGEKPDADAGALADEVISIADTVCYRLDIPVDPQEPPEEPPRKRERRRWQPRDPGDVFTPVEEPDVEGL